MGLTVGNSGTLFWEEPGPPLLLQWQEGIHTGPLGDQNSAENPDSLGWKRSYAPFILTDGTQPSQVGNQTRPPIQSLNQTPPGVMGFGVGRERTIW